MRGLALIALFSMFSLPSWGVAWEQSAQTFELALAPSQLLQQLDSVGLNPQQVYFLRNTQIVRQGVRFYLTRGFVALFKPLAGQITGALFSGQGEVLVRPPIGAERQSMQFFTGEPILEEQFTTLYLRFTDDTAGELEKQARPVDPEATEQPGNFIEDAMPMLERLNPAFSLRILEDLIGGRSHPYFHARVSGVHLGVFDVVIDGRRPEPVSVEAVRAKGGITYQDVWCSFRPAGRGLPPLPPFEPPARVTSYKISTRIHRDNSMEGQAELQLVSQSGTDRVLGFELSSRLRVSSVRDGSGQHLLVFQNSFLKQSPALRYGTNWLMVVLPKPYPTGQTFKLAFSYEGNVIATASSNLLYVGAHESWYPNLGVDLRSKYDLTFYYPRRLTLAATGHLVEEKDSEGWKESRWLSEGPFPVAGFNLGVYTVRTLKQNGFTIEVYATHEAETALENRYEISQLHTEAPTGPAPSHQVTTSVPVAGLDPALLLDAVAKTAGKSVQYFSGLFGPLPYSRLAISQLPGGFGQGWPELVYLPTLAFLPTRARLEMAEAGSGRPLGDELTEPHEIAHQWWGNAVGWKTYHDQWLSEGFASYAAALELKSQVHGDRAFHQLLDGYKKDLLSRNSKGRTVESGGPVWLGQRLTNSLNPRGYQEIVYKKSTWVLEMLRFVLEDPRSHSDAQFLKLLRDFFQTYRGRQPSTEDFARMAASHMPTSADLDRNHQLDWFFQEWVYSTGIPHYHLRASFQRLGPNRYRVEGRITQSGVPANFEMPVPVLAIYRKSRTALLGCVVVTSDSGRFRFITASPPLRLRIDTSKILAVLE
jgi:hypothetical protein